MSKRRAEIELNLDQVRRDSRPQDDDTIVHTDGSWQDNVGTASDEQMAGRRVIKAVRRGGKPLEPENSEEKSTISTSTSSTSSSNPIPSPIPFSFASNSKITFGTATSISSTTATTTTTTSEIKFPNFQAPVVSSPFTFDFTPKNTSTTTPSTTASTTASTTTTTSPSPKAETPKTTSPVSTPTTTTIPKAQFNFGNADASVKWPTFEPAALPVFKPDTGLPPFNLGSTGAKFEINWPTFSPANFNFDIKKPETSVTDSSKPSSPIQPKPAGKIENLEHSDLSTVSADKTLQAIDATKYTPRKPFGSDVDAPNSPVSNTTVVRINNDNEENKPVIEKQENIITGEENEEIVCKGRVKLFEFEEGAWSNKGVGLAKLMKAKDTAKIRLVMRVEGSGNVLLNVPIIPNMEVNYHQQKNVQFVGVNAKGEGNFSICFAVTTEKEEMFKQLKSAVANAKPSASSANKEEEKKD